MEVLIKTYKPKDKSQKCVQKREKELSVLQLFQDQGNKLREATKKHVKKMITKRDSVARNDKAMKKQSASPPPCSAQMPLRKKQTFMGDYVMKSEKEAKK